MPSKLVTSVEDLMNWIVVATADWPARSCDLRDWVVERRTFVAMVSGSLLAAPHAAEAQQDKEKKDCRSPSVRQWIVLFLAAVLVTGSGTLAPSPEGGPVISKFTIEPRIATPGGPVRIRFEFRGAQGGLRDATLLAKPSGSSWRRSVLEEPVNRAIAGLGPSADGVVESPGRHQNTYTREQHGTTNLYELQVTDKTGRKSNVLTAALEVRL